MTREAELVDDEALERAGRRSSHGSSADRWEERERDISVQRAIAVLPESMQRKLADPRAVISPLVVAEEAKAMEDAYQALFNAILTDDDYAWYEQQKQVVETLGNGQRVVRNTTVLVKRKRKSAWRKAARYTNIDVDVTKEVIGHVHDEKTCSRIVMAAHGLSLAEGEDCSCPTTYARYHITVTGWNGRKGFGVGIASRNERAFKAQDHSLPATAYSRGLSRAISDLIAAGEGAADDPAETTDAPKGEGTARPVPPERGPEAQPLTQQEVVAYTDAWKAASDDQRRQARSFLEDQGYRNNFLATGKPDLVRVLEILGSSSPESAPR